jgi:hypothetical protein
MVSDKSSLTIIPQQFHELHKKIEGLFERFGIDPMPNSIAARELSSEYAETVMSAYSYGTQLIEVASDNLSAFTREIVEPVLPFALYPNIRSVLEAASKSVWLLDETININKRISRSYAFRCRGLEQQIKWANDTKNREMIERSKKRYQEVIQNAEKIGITKINKIGETTLVNEMPNFIDMVNEQLHQGEIYRLLSVMTHANHWALIILGFESVADIPHGKIQRKIIKIEVVNGLALIGLDAFQKQLMCKCRLFGWPIEGIEAAFNETRKTLPQNTKS